jgi:DNA-binding HxlR family transcriptional regulator
MADQSYRQFCPVAMAAELLCTRWTVVLLRELMCGAYRFNELRRGLPRISPALLSQRLKELEEAGIVQRRPLEREPNTFEYALTEAGEDLRGVIVNIGEWGQRWVPSHLSLENLDAQLLMWDMRRNLEIDPPPQRRHVIHFRYPDAPANPKAFWLIVEPGQPVDLCSVDPGFDVDLYVSAELRAMTAVWMGLESFLQAKADGIVVLTGDERLAGSLHQWLKLSPFAGVQRRVA